MNTLHTAIACNKCFFGSTHVLSLIQFLFVRFYATKDVDCSFCWFKIWINKKTNKQIVTEFEWKKLVRNEGRNNPIKLLQLCDQHETFTISFFHEFWNLSNLIKNNCCFHTTFSISTRMWTIWMEFFKVFASAKISVQNKAGAIMMYGYGFYAISFIHQIHIYRCCLLQLTILLKLWVYL